MIVLMWQKKIDKVLLPFILVSEVAQSYPTLCDPMDCSLPGSSVHGLFRQEYWSGLPFPSPGDLPNPGIEPGSPVLQTDALPSEPLCNKIGIEENIFNLTQVFKNRLAQISDLLLKC